MGKIIAIGGGNIGETYEGKKYPITTRKIDDEIIRLSGKKHPKLLFVPTASSDSENYVNSIKAHFGKRLKCDVDALYLHKKNLSAEDIRKKVLSSDIIYVGGGNTLMMMNLWKKLGVDKILWEAHNKGKVLSGLSAGSICWFKYGNSDSWKYYDKKRPLIRVSCLGIIDALACPHYNGSTYNRVKDLQKMMKRTPGVAIALDNNCAIEIIDNKYKIIPSQNNANAYKVYWKKGKYYCDKITVTKQLEPINKLLTK